MKKKYKKVVLTPDNWGEQFEVKCDGEWYNCYFDDEEGGVFFFSLYITENPGRTWGWIHPYAEIELTRGQMTTENVRQCANALLKLKERYGKR